MSKEIEIQCTANVYIDEYISEVSDEGLMREMMSRLNKYSQTVKTEFFKELLNYDEKLMINAISASKKLSIIEADKLKQFITNLE